MFITVAIPVYNAERYVRQSIQSVLDQTYMDFELIVTDDGSTDRTLEVLQSFDDARIKIVHDGQHKGLAIRLNEQIAMAQGLYFVRMDADDIMLPERLERQVSFVEKHPETDVVGSSAIIIDEDGKQVGWRSFEWIRGAGRRPGDLAFEEVSNFMHPTVMGRTEWFRKYYYNPACEGCEDQDLWLRSQRTSKFYSLCEPLILYRDPQRLDLKTYLFRQEKGIYVQKLSSGSNDWLNCQKTIWTCRIKSVMAYCLSHIGLSKLILRVRNKQYSPLNNHVFHVITSLRTGGAEKLMVDLLPRLRDNGNHVELIVFDGVHTPFFEALEKQGIKIHAFSVNGSVYNPMHIIKLWRLIRHADIVHTHNTSPQLFAAIANIFVKTKLITTEHNTSNRRRQKAWMKPLDRWMYRQYDKIICISDQAEQNLKAYLPEIGSRVCTIYNGIDLSLSVQTQQVDFCRKNDEVCITMVAAFREQKDQKTLIRAISLLPDNYRLQLVGTGDQNLISECHQLVTKEKLHSRVSFLGMRNDVPTILSESDIIVLSSHYEGLSLSSLEGMASGRPFIASDVDGLHEIVDGFGVLVPHEDSKALATAIKNVAEDDDYARQIAKRCQERAKFFDIEIMGKRYSAEYDSLLTNNFLPVID